VGVTVRNVRAGRPQPSQAAVGSDIVRLEADGLPVASNRLPIFLLVLMCSAQVEVGEGIAWLIANGLPVVRDGLVKFCFLLCA
jgi:hypothetical protein